LNVKIFILAVGDKRRASSRLRVWDHVDWLRAQGHEVTTDYVMPPDVQRVTVNVVWRTLVRWPRWAWQFLRADRVLIQETLLLAPLLWIKSWGKLRQVVFDFSDPVDTIGSGLRNRLQRLGFAAMTRGVNHVIVENATYLAELRCRGIAASQFYGPVDVDRYQAAARAQPPRDRSVVRIGWTGSPGTLSFITPLFPVLDSLAGSHRIELMLIGVTAVEYNFQQLTVYTREWTEPDEFQIVPSFDLGLFALDSSERSKRRGAGKLFIYMAAGVPFVATHLGIARELLGLTAAGYPVDDMQAWIDVLTHAVKSTMDRRRISATAVSYAQKHMSYTAYRHHLIDVLMIGST
jgi:hypothetical protein